MKAADSGGYPGVSSMILGTPWVAQGTRPHDGDQGPLREWPSGWRVRLRALVRFGDNRDGAARVLHDLAAD